VAETLDVVILAGGSGERLGGVSKADLVLGGRRLLDHVLGDLAAWQGPPDLRRVVVVAPPTVAVPDGVLRTLEDPPDGGPAAGIAAALDLLGEGDLVAVLTCDAPRSARALPALLAAVGADGAVARSAAGFDQYLLGVYRFAALAGRLRGARDMSVRRLLGALDLARIECGDLDRDVDSWGDLAALEAGG